VVSDTPADRPEQPAQSGKNTGLGPDLRECISVFKCHAEGVAIAPNQSTLVDTAKIIEGQFKVQR
jgi:hypothetical protein